MTTAQHFGSVTVASLDPHTLHELPRYLNATGLATRTTRRLDQLSQLPEGETALVLFPDSFPTAAVVEALAHVRSSHPHVLIVVVTSDPRRFSSSALAPLKILDKPTFSWSIVDAVREHSIGRAAT